jgi:type VI secretion system VasD/TssJ family lipoprotein
MIWKLFGLMVMVLSSSAVCGCGGSEPRPECKESEDLFLNFSASTDLNRDVDGSARSTYVHVFQLSNASMAAQATFAALWSEPKALLADTLLDGPRELILTPGGRIARRLIRHPDANILLFVGNFRQMQADNRWRSMVALPAATDPCAVSGPGKHPSALTVDLLVDGYQIYSKTNFQATTRFEAFPNTTTGSVVQDPDWREPGSRPASPPPANAPQPAVQPSAATRPAAAAHEDETRPEPSASPQYEESGPARNPRLRRVKKKAPPASPRKQESEVPLL